MHLSPSTITEITNHSGSRRAVIRTGVELESGAHLSEVVTVRANPDRTETRERTFFPDPFMAHGFARTFRGSVWS